MLNDHKKISVIIPVYNVEQYVEKSITSVINQTYKNLEIIIINDGSTDNCEAIIKRIIKNDNRCILISREYKGIGYTRTEGLSKATGDYIAWVDSDDYIELNMFEVMIDNMNEHESDMVICDVNLHYSDGKVKRRGFWADFEDVINVNDVFDEIVLRLPCEVWCRLVKTSVYKDIVFPNTIGQDKAVLLDVIRKCKRISFTKETLYNYLIDRIGNTVTNKTYRQFDERLNVEINFFNQLVNLQVPQDVLVEQYAIFCLDYYLRQNKAYRKKARYFKVFSNNALKGLSLNLSNKLMIKVVRRRNTRRIKRRKSRLK